jgi:hypothetical protein
MTLSNAEASSKGDSIEVYGGYGALNIYGRNIETTVLANPHFLARYVKDFSGGWGGAAEYLGGLGTGFGGFTIGTSYDLSPFVFSDTGSEVTFDDGSLVERHSLWRLRGLVGLGGWTYSGVVKTTGETRIPKRAISATVYGMNVGVVLDRMVSKKFALHLGASWLTGFAADFGGQQVSLAAGLGWVGI